MIGSHARLAIEGLLDAHTVLESQRPAIEAAADLLCQSVRQDGTIFTCGNGGSAAEAAHLVGDLMKSFCFPRPIATAHRDALVAVGGRGGVIADALEMGIRAVALTADSVLSSAIANDIGYGMVFAQQLSVLGHPGDVLIALTTSGASENTINAAYVARACGVAVLAIAGPDDSELSALADITIAAPARGVDRIQDLHAPICHALAHVLEAEFFAPAARPAEVILD